MPPHAYAPLSIARNLTLLLASGSLATAAQTTDSLQLASLEPQTILVDGYKDKQAAELNYFPATTATISAEQLETNINAINVEDAVKYLPSITVRKRYIGDTNAPVATRTTGINASARSLIYADGVLLSTLIANNNGNGSPQWFMLSPDEIERVAISYGPFSAAYAGNAYGGVVDISTRMPSHFEGGASIRGALQDFKQYGTEDSYKASDYNLYLGDKAGDFSWLVTAGHLDSYSHPISYAIATAITAPATTRVSGGYADSNRTGAPIQVVGAGNLNHTLQDTAKLKFAYDFTPTLTASYSIAQWKNNAEAEAETYLKDEAGEDYFGGSANINLDGRVYSGKTLAGLFARNQLDEERRYQSLSLTGHNDSTFNWKILASDFEYVSDITRSSTALYPLTYSGGAGRINDASGTGWSTLDLTGTFKTPSSHILSIGMHGDRYKLVSPTYDTSDWISGDKDKLYTNSLGQTKTHALWLQDVIQIDSQLKATLGVRYEEWQAYNGYNYAVANTTVNPIEFAVNQPQINKSGVSPKASLSWQADQVWTITGSVGKALRFPTVGELYQNIATGTSFTAPNPNLNPEKVIAEEIAFERRTQDGKLRISLFDEGVRDAIISQTSTISSTYPKPVSFAQNVDRTHQRGIEIVLEQNDLFINGYDLSASVTYAEGEIMENSSYAPTTSGATSVGKNTPYVPKWRATLVNTYQATPKLALTLAGRYSSRQYATVDNTDIYTATYQGFQGYALVDVRAAYKIDKNWTAALGVDNLNNRSYFLFHPFPQRSAFAEVKYRF